MHGEMKKRAQLHSALSETTIFFSHTTSNSAEPHLYGQKILHLDACLFQKQNPRRERMVIDMLWKQSPYSHGTLCTRGTQNIHHANKVRCWIIIFKLTREKHLNSRHQKERKGRHALTFTPAGPPTPIYTPKHIHRTHRYTFV